MKSRKLRGIGMTSQRTRERLMKRLRLQGIRDVRVFDALRNTPRHIFVDEALASRAYDDDALPIGYGQTISQPYIVARMTEVLLERGSLHNVLEIGTGSGYQSAILAGFVEQIYSVERIEALIRLARSRFMALGIRNIRLKHSDGHWGWADYAPYDGIVVTAAPTELPSELLSQLAIGGRLIIPIGHPGQQSLQLITRDAEAYQMEVLEHVSFVPLRTGNTP